MKVRNVQGEPEKYDTVDTEGSESPTEEEIINWIQGDERTTRPEAGTLYNGWANVTQDTTTSLEKQDLQNTSLV